MSFGTGDSRRRRGSPKDSASSVDIAIVGAGPAGLLAAEMLARKNSVLVADRLPVGAGKCCAGLLSAEALSFLPGLGDDAAVFEEPSELELVSVVGGRLLPGEAFRNVDRGALQAWMAARAEAAGASVVRTELKSIAPARHSWNLVLDDDKLVLASVIIGADGYNSATRSALGLPPAPVVAARQGIFEGRLEKAHLVLDRDEAGIHYCWAVPKKCGILVGAAVAAGAEGAADFPEGALRALGSACPGFETGAQLAGERGAFTRVRSVDDIRLGLPGAFLIGEAAGLVLPSSGEGLGGALASAAAVAAVLLEEGTAGAGLGRPGSGEALERYRERISPRVDRIAADLSFLEAFEAGRI